jgi:hypothetical protein
MNENINFPYYSISLNKKQFEIVTNEDLNSQKLILSCAGSGKTLTITARICYMIYKLGCNPNEFILATFNRNAAEEMNQRICKFIGFNEVNCGTFHSLGLRLLRKYDYMFLDEEYHIDETQLIFLKFLNSERSNILKEKIKYVFIDEFQDINDTQIKIIKELSKIAKNIFLVGDDLQNIYSFRGSNNNIILNIKKYFPDIQLESMHINYRSSPEIINLANEIQKMNKHNFKKEMIPNNDKNILPKILIFDNLSKEINYIVSSIISDLKKGYKKKQIAILCRTNMPLYFLEEKLQKCGVKNKILTSENYLSNCISLSTIHSAKGLEWEKVYLVGMNNSYFPNPKSDIEEERRLFYVAVTRAKNNLIITLNKKDECSSLLLEINEEIFTKDFNFNDVIYNINELPKEKQIDNSVTKIISNLNGEDYIKLKELDIFENIKFTEKKVYDSYEHPEWVIKEDYYAEFGCFVDYLIRRMIANNNKNWNESYSGFYDKRANEVITSCFLKTSLYYKWCKYHKGILACLKLYRHKTKINRKEKSKIFNNFYKDYDSKEDKNIETIIEIIINNKNIFQNDTMQSSLSFRDINITNKIYIPFGLKQLFTKSYVSYTNKNTNWDKIIWEIFLISKCHSVWGDRRKCLYINIDKEKVLGLDSFYKDINNFISRLTDNKIVFCNPDLNDGLVFGDADLIIENEILDIKTSSKKDINIEYTLQLLIYTSLARYKGMKIDKISIFNPLLGIYHYCDVSEWNKNDDLLEYLHNKN